MNARMEDRQSIVCAACGRSNRAAAMFCIGCARRLPTFVASGPSALEAFEAQRGGSDARVGRRAPTRALPAETPAFWLRLGLLVLAMAIAFIAWYAYVTRKAAGPAPPPASAAPPAAVATGRDAATTPAAVMPVPAPGEPSPAVTPTPAAPLPAPRDSDAPAAPAPAPPDSPTPTSPSSIADPPARKAMPPRPPSADASVETVAAFYRALSAADGTAAAALVVPAKRAAGPFAAESISRFYRSLKEPLVVRSVRAIDADRVEARYRYRAATTPCEGRAIVETESVRGETLIRRIRANC